ncbi:cytochrome P450 [Kitasatospora sp. DSM 101779]|uniref:cytochrome P450 n=1 Tax=Kitasatospora sp. DSM 101779 TaxID=2853165 RepID=UPI0021D7DCD4|nr:cytochrome P450 [Kitasatospora sp. DSM 101779]MCU7821994.1 cytochrome P450 [Kitasatospora sp. DSM 101779]
MDSLRHELTRFIQQPAAQQDPPALYRRLLAGAPVLDLGRVHVVSGYEEIVTVLMHPGTAVDPTAVGLPRAGATALSRVVDRMLPMRDGADHTRLKRLATTAFSARRLEQMRERIEVTVERMLEPLLAAGSFDVVADLAVPLPVAVSCAILDIPDTEQERVTGWARLVARSLLDDFDGTDGAARIAELDAEFEEFRGYVENLCATRAAEPGDDLISRLAAARGEGRLDDQDLLAFVVMLLANGLETLTSGLSFAVWQLLHTPGLAERLRERPADAAAVFDEAQRLGSPVRASARALTRDVEVGGTVIPAGRVVLLLYAAANRDPRRFADPDRFDPDRAELRHLAFGHGPHHCLGAPLSLMAGAAVLWGLAAAGEHRGLSTPLTTRTASWSTQFVFGGLRELPLHCPPRPVLTEVGQA